MEIIILFLLFMILSAVMRALGERKARAPKRPGQPRELRPRAPYLPDFYQEEEEDTGREPAGTTGPAGPQPPPVPRARQPIRGGMVGAEDPSVYTSRRQRTRDPGSETSTRMRRREAPGEQKSVQAAEIAASAPPKARPVRTGSRPAEPAPDLQKELARLVGGPQISTGIVIAEIISAPRSRRPHRRGFL